MRGISAPQSTPHSWHLPSANLSPCHFPGARTAASVALIACPTATCMQEPDLLGSEGASGRSDLTPLRLGLQNVKHNLP